MLAIDPKMVTRSRETRMGRRRRSADQSAFTASGSRFMNCTSTSACPCREDAGEGHQGGGVDGTRAASSSCRPTAGKFANSAGAGQINLVVDTSDNVLLSGNGVLQLDSSF
jgi:hypothetical protein